MNRSLVLRWGPWNIFYSCHRVPGSAKTEEGCAGRNPATPVTGGEGDVGELKEETEPHPLVPVARRERVGGGRSAVDSEAAAEALVGGGVPVGIG